MTTYHRPPASNEPLTPDERAWAARLARIGPHDGPSMALDTRILAAARAAVAQRSLDRPWRRRWPRLVGAAASLVIVIGLAWQLQPLLRSTPSLGEVPAAAQIPRSEGSSEGSLPADVLAAADPVASTATDNPPAPPGPAIVPAPGRQLAPRPTVPKAEPQVPPPRSTAFDDDAIPPDSEYAGTAAARQAASQSVASDASTGTSNERRERAAADTPRSFPADVAGEARTPTPAPRAAAPAESVEQRGSSPLQDVPVAAKASSPPPTTQAKAAAEHDDTGVHRIGGTGSRLSLAELAVREDSRLEPAAWLQRIRDRRNAEDLDGARASLALFRQAHPRIRLPDDIARLEP
ncbi:MAG TPA: hypothetical protein VIK70_07580 [Lysobacter sp.]